MVSVVRMKLWGFVLVCLCWSTGLSADITSLQQAVAEQDLSAFADLHRQRLSKAELESLNLPELRDDHGDSLLHLAVRRGDLDAVEFLIRQGFDRFEQNEHTLNAFEVAISEGRLDVLQLLLDDVSTDDFPTGTGIFADPKIVYWAYLYWADEKDRVLQLVERDLASSTPHPLSAFIWSVTHARLGTLNQSIESASDKLRAALGHNPEVELLDYDDHSDKLLAKFAGVTEFTPGDYFVLVRLAFAAQDTEQYDLSKQYLEQAIRLYPDIWQNVWTYENRLHETPALLERARRFAEDPAIQGTLAGDYIKTLVAAKDWKTEDRLDYQKKHWLDARPDDPRLNASVGFNYASKWRYKEALPRVVRSVARFPWYSSSSTPLFYMSRTGQEQRGARYAELSARWYETDPDKIKQRGLQRLTSQLVSEGNKGYARQLLDKALQESPDSIQLMRAMAELEEADKRWPEAADWAERALAGNPFSLPDLFQLQLNALSEDGAYSHVIELYESAQNMDGFINEDVHLVALRAYKTAQRYGELEQQLDAVLAKFPDSKAIGRLKAEELWRQKRTRPAFQLVEDMLAMYPKDRDLIKLALQYGEEIHNQNYLAQWLEEKMAAQPWNEDLAREYLDFKSPGASTAAKLEFWQGLQERNSDVFFACRRAVVTLTSARRYQQAWDTAVACENDTLSAGAQVSERLSSARHKIYVIEQWSKRNRLDHEFVREAAADWHEIADHYSESLSNYYRYEEQICQAIQDMECAAEALYQRSLFVRSNTSIFHNLVARYRSELNDNQTMGYGARMLGRDPYNVNVVNSFLHKHILWSGSSIVALKAISEAKARGLSPNRTHERNALGRLGDPYSKFKGYSDGNYPGASQRYVRWFDDSREAALFDEAKQIRYLFDDDDHPGIEIVLPNGEVAVRRDHGVFGKIAYLGKGAGFVRFEYTDLGQLSAVEESSGKRVELYYNDAGEIERFLAANGRTLLFTYNEDSRPVVIEMQDVGSINVTYKPDGSIDKVDSEQGHEMSLQVTRAFQELLSLVNYAKRADQLDRLPSFEFVDEELDELRAAYEGAEVGSSKHREAEEALASYLVEHIKDSNDYFWEAQDLLYNMLEAGQSSDANKKAKQRAARAVKLWYELHKAVKPHGLPAGEFASWSAMRNWLVAYSIQSKDRAAKDYVSEFDRQPLTLLRDAHWLKRSAMANSGFWKRSGDDALTGSKQRPANKQTVLIRQNGDVVVGTRRGLSVRRQGHWQWFGFDDSKGRLSNNMSPNQVGDTSDILSLAETEDGTLWLGTARGLYALSGEYLADLQRWRTNQEGLPSPRVMSLATRGQQVFVGTALGVVTTVDGETLTPLKHAEKTVADELISVEYASEPTLIVLSKQGLELVSDSGREKIANNVSLVTYGQELGTVFWQDNTGLIMARDLEENDRQMVLRDETPRVLARGNDLLMSRQVHELEVWPVPGVGETLVVNTDIAVNVLNDNYFQAMSLPFEVTRGGLDLGPVMSARRNLDIVALTDEGVYRFAPSEVTQIFEGPIHDILTDDEFGITYVATGSGLRYIDHDDRGYMAWLNGASAKRLAQDSRGNLITHDRNTILMIERGDTQPRELFDAEPSPDVEGFYGTVNDLLVDSNDVIWVASGSSVFRYQDGEVQEFNYILDPQAFPSRSNMIFRVYEDNAGDIYAVASDEAHLNHEGVDLSGGALKWNGTSFDNTGREGHWFATSYTSIADDLAIVGTNKTLVREKGGDRQSFTDLQDVTFEEMRKTNKMLWLAGEGAQVGEGNSWLFPTAGGVVVYHEGQWLYPDRLNQLLPDDQALGQYGARTSHAVSVDKSGTVYVGTDLGLLVYRSDGIESLLTDNYRGQLAFSGEELKKHRELTDVFMNAIKPDSPQGRLLTRYQKLDSEISQTQAELDGAEGDGGNAMADPNRRQETMPEDLKRRLRENERNRQRLLARMEKEEPGLFQMLQFDPREASAMNERLADNQALIQFLPTRKSLQIQVVTSDGAIIRQVDVPREELMRQSVYAAAALRDGVLDLYDLKATRGGGTPSPSFEDIEELDIDISWEATRGRLSWLYEHMFRPVERDLEGKDQIFVTSVGSLTYLPFGALIRDDSEVIEYAVQRYNIGVLPSLFHYGLVVDYEESYLADVLFIADPDGSLPGARQEVKSISEQMYDGKVILEGEEATLNAVDEYAPESRIIHFATHGVLNEESPADSYLLLADQRRLSVVDISTMDLGQTDIVVLSACESGVGTSGLEYATLARAFAHAKVPSVLASYWEVHDEATRMLMTNFYGALQENPDIDYFAALSQAQRAMIAEGGKASHPSAWSGFSIFGRP